MTRTLGAACAVGGFVTAALAAGWIGAVLLIVAILIPAAALCWILADRDRPHRLALLLTAWRHGTPTPAAAHYNPPGSDLYRRTRA